MFVLVLDGKVHQVFGSDPQLGDLADVRDASAYPDIAEGWIAKADGKFVAPPARDWAPRVPDVTAVQAKIQLSRTPTKDGSSNLLKDAKELVAKEGGEVELYFDGAPTWERSNTYVGLIGKALDQTDEEMNELFFAASKIN